MGSYGRLWKARFELMRPGNGLMVVVAVWIGAAHTVPDAWMRLAAAFTQGTEVGIWILAPLAAFLVNGFGNTINDIGDVIIDRKAHQQRPLPSGRIRMADARGWAVMLFVMGVSLAYLAAGKLLLAFALVNATLLMLYEWRLKAWPIVGNLVIAALVASAFAFGSIAAGGRPSQWDALWWMMAMVALVNVAREVLKDLEDQDADTNRRTLPRVIGAGPASWAASILVGIAVGLDFGLVYQEAAWTTSGRVVLGIAGAMFLVASGAGCYRAGLGQRWLKWAMLVALLGFAVV